MYAVTAVLSVFFSFFDLRFQSSGFVVIAPESNGDIGCTIDSCTDTVMLIFIYLSIYIILKVDESYCLHWAKYFKTLWLN